MNNDVIDVNAHTAQSITLQDGGAKDRTPLTAEAIAPAINEIKNFAAQRGYTVELIEDAGRLIAIQFI